MGRGKRNKEFKEIEDYYNVITERRTEVIQLSKEATDIVEISRNTDTEAREKERRENYTGRRKVG